MSHSSLPNGNVSVLSQFISWLNLDFGIETCFFNGLTPVIKVWLQIVFPIYIGVIIIIVIIVSHFSEKVAKLMGNNAVPVLSTLLLLSYMKIIRWLVQALSVSEVKYNSDVHYVWRVDGNINYSTGQHLPLFITALGSCCSSSSAVHTVSSPAATDDGSAVLVWPDMAHVFQSTL